MTAISTPVNALWVRCTAVWTIVLLSTAQCALQIRFGRLYRSYRMSRNAELGTDLKTSELSAWKQNWELRTGIRELTSWWAARLELAHQVADLRNRLRNFRPLCQVRGSPVRSQPREVQHA